LKRILVLVEGQTEETFVREVLQTYLLSLGLSVTPRLAPGYQKRLYGPLIARRIGLDEIRRQCPHFAGWLGSLEGLANS